MKLYALYKGDDFIDIGTTKELAQKLNVKEETIRFYATSTWKNKTNCESWVVVSIEEDKEDE